MGQKAQNKKKTVALKKPFRAGGLSISLGDDDDDKEEEECEKDDAVKLTGELQQVLDIWQLRQNMICIMTLLSISSFAYYLLDL